MTYAAYGNAAAVVVSGVGCLNAAAAAAAAAAV